MGKLGRPKKPKGEAKGRRAGVRLTPHERLDCEKAAKKVGKKLSEWMRDELNAAAARVLADGQES